MPDSTTPPIEDQRRFWNWHWQHWKERRAVNDWTERRAEKLLEFIRDLALDHPRLLDLGCGRGWFTERLSRLGEATGIDLSEEAITAARSEYPGITFMAGNIYEAPLPLEHFDVVVSQEVIAHVEDQAAYVDRAADVLRPGGYLAVSTANKFVLDRLGDVGWNRQPPEHISRHFDMKGLGRLLERRFDVMRKATVVPMGQKGVLRLANSLKLNTVLGWIVSRRRLEALKERAGLGYHMIVLARKRS